MSDKAEGTSEASRGKRANGSAGRLWADVSMMQSLEEQLNASGSIAAESRRSFQRGPESYTLPDGVKFDDREFHDDEDNERQTTADDGDGGDSGGKAEPSLRKRIDFFADDDDLAAVESFGVAAPSRKRRRQHGERSAAEAERHYERKFRYGHVGVSDGPPALHSQRRNASGRAHEKRARLSGVGGSRNSSRYGSTSTLASADGSGVLSAAARSDRFSRLRGYVAPDYSTDQLFTAEFPPNVGLAELGTLIAAALGEIAPAIVEESVESLGKEVALAIFGATKSAEAAGGLMTMSGRRRRTPGGVFLYLAKLWQAGEWQPGQSIPAPTLPPTKMADGSGSATVATTGQVGGGEAPVASAKT